MSETPDGAEVVAAGESRTESAESAESSGSQPRLSALRMLARAVSWALLVLVAAVAALVIVVPAASGAQTFTVLTGSMKPGHPPGTLVVVRAVAADDLAIGDIVTYQLESGKPTVVTHRIVGAGTAGDGERIFITQGDANEQPDAAPVRAVQIVGRLWYSVPYIGWVNNLVTGELRAYIVPIVVLGLFGYAIVEFVKAARARRRRRAPDARDGA